MLSGSVLVSTSGSVLPVLSGPVLSVLNASVIVSTKWFCSGQYLVVLLLSVLNGSRLVALSTY